MGAVYEGRHTGTGRRVAVKVVSGAFARDPDLCARFEREARAAGAIESEHVAQVLDVGRDGATGAPFLAMELLVGEDLAQLFERLGPVPAEVALRIGVQACLGLEKAHALGIVHRDVKPANLFLTRRDNGELVVKILDFGIAKIHDEDLGPEQKKRPLTRTGAILGSPLYMSPEQCRYRGRLDHRTDLWSLGIVLYQALTGQTPLDHAESFGDFIVAVCTTPATPLRDLAPWVDPMLASAVERALTIDPEGRYPSAAAMREALSVFLQDGAPLRAPMLVRAPEAGPPPPPPATPAPPGATQSATPVALMTDATQVTPPPSAATSLVAEGNPPGHRNDEPGLSGSPEPSPARAPTPAPATVIAPTPTPPATIPGEPVSAAFAPATPLPAPTIAPARSVRGIGARIAAILAVAAGGGLAGVYALGWMGAGATAPVPPANDAPTAVAREASAPPAPLANLAPLVGAWWGEGGVAYDAVVTGDAGDAVELRIRDPELLAGQGYAAGEPVFVLRPVAAEPGRFQVEARVRPAPPRGLAYDRARATASCVASWTSAAGKPLLAVQAIDRLVVQTVRIDPAPAVFAREGLRVVSCSALGESHAVEAEIVLGRTATAAPPKWPLHDAGAHDAGGIVHDAGAGHDGGAARDAGPSLPSGKGFGAPCSVDTQCASRRCVATMCQ
jgi:serine/threonine-protein kinase